MPTAEVIKQLSPVIRGWCNYTATRWPSARSPTWTTTSGGSPTDGPNAAIPERTGARWSTTTTASIRVAAGTCGTADTASAPRRDLGVTLKVRGKANPFDPSLRDYWEDRLKRRLVREASHIQRVHLLQRQAGRCAACKAVFDPAPAFKAWLEDMARRVAEASKEGGFLGFGGVQVSDAERATLAELSAALTRTA